MGNNEKGLVEHKGNLINHAPFLNYDSTHNFSKKMSYEWFLNAMYTQVLEVY